MQHELASRAPTFVQNENLPIFRGVDGKKAGTVRGPAARAGRRERRALGDLGGAGKAPPAGAGGKTASAGAQSVGGSKGVAMPSYLSDGDWMKCREWAKDGIETASFTGNDVQRLMADQREQRIRKKKEKAIGALQVSMESIYDIDVPSKLNDFPASCYAIRMVLWNKGKRSSRLIYMDDPDDEIKLELETEFLSSTAHLSSRLGDDANYLLSDLEFEHEPFAYCNFDLKLKDEY